VRKREMLHVSIVCFLLHHLTSVYHFCYQRVLGAWGMALRPTFSFINIDYMQQGNVCTSYNYVFFFKNIITWSWFMCYLIWVRCWFVYQRCFQAQTIWNPKFNNDFPPTLFQGNQVMERVKYCINTLPLVLCR